MSPESKVCTKCRQVKPLHCFSKRKEKWRSRCKECISLHRNKEKDKERAKHNYYKDGGKSRAYASWRRRLERRRKWYRELKATLRCSECEESRPACLQFHHKDPSQKTKAVARLILQGNKLETILEEIAKCEVLCANCHLARHWEKSYDS